MVGAYKEYQAGQTSIIGALIIFQAQIIIVKRYKAV